MSKTRTFYRYVSLPELEDWREFGRLRPGKGAVNEKFLTDSEAHALEWWRRFRDLGWYAADEGGAILEIEVTKEQAEQFEYRGDNYDRIGPAWAADPAVLNPAEVKVVREWSPDEDPT